MYPLFIYCGRLSDHPSNGTLTDVFDKNVVHLTGLTTQWKALLRKGRTTLRGGEGIAQIRTLDRQLKTQYCNKSIPT